MVGGPLGSEPLGGGDYWKSVVLKADEIATRLQQAYETDIAMPIRAVGGAPATAAPVPNAGLEALTAAINEVRDAVEEGNRPDRVMRAVGILALLVAILAIALGYIAPPGGLDEPAPREPAPQQQPPEPPPTITPV